MSGAQADDLSRVVPQLGVDPDAGRRCRPVADRRAPLDPELSRLGARDHGRDVDGFREQTGELPRAGEAGRERVQSGHGLELGHCLVGHPTATFHVAAGRNAHDSGRLRQAGADGVNPDAHGGARRSTSPNRSDVRVSAYGQVTDAWPLRGFRGSRRGFWGMADVLPW